MNALDDICTPKITAKRLEKTSKNAYSTSSSHASTVLSVLYDHLCKMLIAAPPGIGFFAYSRKFWYTLCVSRIFCHPDWQHCILVVFPSPCSPPKFQVPLISISPYLWRKSLENIKKEWRWLFYSSVNDLRVKSLFYWKHLNLIYTSVQVDSESVASDLIGHLNVQSVSKETLVR